MIQDSPKLVFAGPVGTGKSTAIGSIADGDPVSTDVPMTDGVMGDKTTTTVALDFATVQLDEDTSLLVYGAPGQDHFAFMRPILMQGAIGVILLLNAADPGIADQCEDWLVSIREVDADMAISIGVTHVDEAELFSLPQLRATVQRCGRALPIFTFDARSPEQTAHLVRAMLVSR